MDGEGKLMGKITNVSLQLTIKLIPAETVRRIQHPLREVPVIPGRGLILMSNGLIFARALRRSAIKQLDILRLDAEDI
jgi:hypothetical protein